MISCECMEHVPQPRRMMIELSLRAVARAKDPELQIGAFIGQASSLAYGVRKEDAKLFQALNGYVSNLRKTPTWSRLVVKYFGAAAPEILKKAREAK